MDPLIDLSPAHLVTERLLLRTWDDADEPRMLALSTDPAVMRYFLRHLTAEDVHAFVDRQRALLATGRPGLFAVETRHDRQFLGFVGLAEPAFEAFFTPCVEVGWRLAAAAWGKGYATEAARAVLDHGFGALGLEEVVSFTATVNLPSIAVMERLGMRRDPAEDFEHPSVPPGHPVRRHVLYRVTRDEWAAR